jgi:hypothetical protein
MADLSLPFSASDVLERVIPGSLVLASYGYAFDGFQHVPPFLNNAIIAPVIFFSCAYAVGVGLNAVAGFVKIREYRKYWSSQPTEREVAIKNAIELHFKIHADDEVWRLCYGTCAKNGYGSNTPLFLGIEVFCRAMTIVALLAAIAFVIALYRRWTDIALHLVLTSVSLALAWIFHRGARIYSQAFVASIYEGFFSWYCDNRNSRNSIPDTSKGT